MYHVHLIIPLGGMNNYIADLVLLGIRPWLRLEIEMQDSWMYGDIPITGASLRHARVPKDAAQFFPPRV